MMSRLVIMKAGASLERVAMQEQMLQQPLKDAQIRKGLMMLVAIDDSDGSFYALNWALDHLVEWHRPTKETGHEESGMATLVHVQQPFRQHTYPAGPVGAGLRSVVYERLNKS